MANKRLNIPEGFTFKNNYKFTVPEGYTLSDMKKGAKWEQDQKQDVLEKVEEITKGKMVEELVRGLSNPKKFEN